MYLSLVLQIVKDQYLDWRWQSANNRYLYLKKELRAYEETLRSVTPSLDTINFVRFVERQIHKYRYLKSVAEVKIDRYWKI